MGVTNPDQQLIDVHAHFLTDAYVSAARAVGDVRPDGWRLARLVACQSICG